MICGRPIFHRACILLRFPLPIGAAKRGFREGCTLVVDRLCDFQSDLGLHHHGDLFWLAPFFLIVLADYNPFRQINGVWCHGWMAPCQVTFDVQDPRGGTAPRNRTCFQGRGVSRKSDIMLKTPLEPNLKNGGVWGGGLRKFFAARGYCQREGHPGPPNPPPPPPNEIHSVRHLRTVGYAAQV